MELIEVNTQHRSTMRSEKEQEVNGEEDHWSHLWSHFVQEIVRPLHGLIIFEHVIIVSFPDSFCRNDKVQDIVGNKPNHIASHWVQEITLPAKRGVQGYIFALVLRQCQFIRLSVPSHVPQSQLGIHVKRQ